MKIRKPIAIPIIISLILFLSPLSHAGLVSTKVEGVNLREGPGLGYKIIMDLGKFEPLKVIAKKGNWLKVVNWMGVKGWISSSLVSNERTVVVKKIRVNLRSGPGRGYRKVTTLYKGFVLKVLKRYKSWYKVIVVDPPGHGQGWVYRYLVWG